MSARASPAAAPIGLVAGVALSVQLEPLDRTVVMHGRSSKKKRKSSARPKKPAPEEKPRKSMRAGVAVAILGVVVLGAGLLNEWRRTTAPLEVPKLADASQLEPSLAERLAELLKAIEQNPQDASAHGQLGVLYEAHGMFDLALTCYENAVTLDPSAPRWFYHWGVLAQRSGESEAAEDALNKVADLQPDYAAAHERLGLLCLDRSDYREAANCFRRVMNLRPNESGGYVGSARVHIARKEFQQAITMLNTALRIAPSRADAHYLLGLTYRALGQTKKAGVELALGREAVEATVLDPWRTSVIESRVTHAGRLKVAEEMMVTERVLEAIEILEECVAAKPEDVIALNDLAFAYLRAERAADAERVLRKALVVRDDHFPTLINLAVARETQEDLHGALRYATQATELAPTVGRTHQVKGLIHAKLGQYEQALASFERTLELDTRNPLIHGAVGDMLTRLGRLEDAIDAYVIALELQPQSINVRLSFGHLLRRTGRTQDAIDLFREALKIDPNHAIARKMLTRAEAQLASN